MAKKRKEAQSVTNNVVELKHEHGRGVIQDNALKAIVTSELFKTRVVKAKKGKGSFSRGSKHKGKEPYSKQAAA